MPPSTPQKVLDQAKAAIQTVQDKINPPVETSDAKAVELHTTEGVAAPLHDAAASMPSAVQSAMNSTTTAMQNVLPEGTTEQVKAATEIVSTKAEEVAALATGAATGASAAVASAIPDEHKEIVQEKVIKPVQDAVSSAVPEGKQNGDSTVAGGALAYVASGFGAALKTVTGVDPVNMDKAWPPNTNFVLLVLTLFRLRSLLRRPSSHLLKNFHQRW